jgi:hypothetical protein
MLSMQWVDLIKSDPKDVRIGLIKRTSSSSDQLSGYGDDGKHTNWLNKYLAPAYNTSCVPVLRMSEAYTIAAEAAAKLGDSENAAKYLNVIVQRADPDSTVSPEDATLDRILTEDRKEFVGEGHRFFDAMRNNLTIHRDSRHTASYSAIRNDPDKTDIKPSYYKTVLAIPHHEIDSNPNIQQNPGY